MTKPFDIPKDHEWEYRRRINTNDPPLYDSPVTIPPKSGMSTPRVEGLHSLLVDESHNPGNEIMDRLNKAGITRSKSNRTEVIFHTEIDEGRAKLSISIDGEIISTADMNKLVTVLNGDSNEATVVRSMIYCAVAK